MMFANEKNVALKAVMAAAQVCEAIRHEIVPQAMEKNDKSPVTIADYGAQAVICHHLKQAFPSDPIVAEEDAVDLKQAAQRDRLEQVTSYVQRVLPAASAEQILDWIDDGNGLVASRYWTLDPIDGTKGFLRGDQYAVALALVEEGEIKVGVLACPALEINGHQGILFVAVQGQGATMMPLAGGTVTPLQVVQASNAAQFRMVESVESGHGNHDQQSAIAQAVGIAQAPIRMDSQAKYGAVAAGQAALYLRLPSPKSPDYREKIWDHAAGVLLVQEAGGRVTDMHGKPLDFSQSAKLLHNQGVIVSNGAIHDTVLNCLKQPISV
jgi:3'(2'), 5'-bisphosphate nucleotidase